MTTVNNQLIYTKMVDVMKEIGAIEKDKTNSAQGYRFRGIDQFLTALNPALIKNRVFLTTEVVSSSHEIREVTRSNGKAGLDKHVTLTMKYTFHAEDGSSVSSTIVSEGLDSGDKATNKALSAALKYALTQTFSIPTEDIDDQDADSPVIRKSGESKTIVKPVKNDAFKNADQTSVGKTRQAEMAAAIKASEGRWTRDEVVTLMKTHFKKTGLLEYTDHEYSMLLETIKISTAPRTATTETVGGEKWES